MKLNRLGQMLHDHMAEHRPKMFQELKESGKLKSLCQEIGEQVADQMGEPVNGVIPREVTREETNG